MAQVSGTAEARETDRRTSVAAARNRDLQLEAEEGDAPFITEELDRQGPPCIAAAHESSSRVPCMFQLPCLVLDI